MSILAEPVMIFATVTGRAEPRTQVAGHPRQRSTTVHSAVPPRRGRPVDRVGEHRGAAVPARPSAGRASRSRQTPRAGDRDEPADGRPTGAPLRRTGRTPDDLAQVAAVALIKAVDGYDPSRQVPFAGFAVPSILGALKRHFRDTAWAMRVPRPIQELALKVPAVAEELGQQRGRTPTTAELADYLQVTVDDVLAAVGAWQ